MRLNLNFQENVPKGKKIEYKMYLICWENNDLTYPDYKNDKRASQSFSEKYFW